jgi:hypothetical protein
LRAVNAGIDLIPDLVADFLFQFQKGVARPGCRRIASNAHGAKVFQLILSVNLFLLVRQGYNSPVLSLSSKT